MGLVRRRQGGVAVAVSALQDQNRRPPGGRCSPAGSAAPALVACKEHTSLDGRGSGGALEGSAVQWAVQPRRRLFFVAFIPFVASSRHRAAGPSASGWGPGLRGGVQCRAKPEAGYELSLYSLAGPTSMATCLLHCRPRDGEAPCTVAQRLRYGMFLPPPPMGRHAGRARAVSGCFGRRAAEDPLSSGWAG